MQLPHELQHFEHPTLLVVADHEHAQFWLAHGEQLEELEKIDSPRERKSDDEYSSINPATGRTHSSPEQHHDDRLRQYEQDVALRITDLIRDKIATRYHLVMIAELANSITDGLTPDIQAQASWPIADDLLKSPPLEAVTRVVEKY